MRFLLIAAVLIAFAATQTARAQESEMDRAETELRATMAPAGADVQRISPDEVRVRMPSDITFDFNRAEVKRQFMPRIRDLARTLNGHPSMSIDIVGHADAIGSDDYNQRLSEQRARSVGARLMDFGVDYGRIETSGRGEWDPIASNESDYGRSRNRRVEISVHSGYKK